VTVFTVSRSVHTSGDEMELRSISSTIAAGNSISLTIPDVVCAVLCS
jgi:hypothetical protein